MRKAKWLVMFLLGLAVAAPASAVELNLGGFPSYMSTRARYLENATYKNASGEDDAIFFVDTTLRVTPQLVLSDTVTVRAQIDIFDNNVWGGSTDQLLGGASTLVNSGISPSDKFRGNVLHGNATSDCLTFGNVCAVEKDAGFFNVRMLHADIVLPNELGFVRVGRQPFDWGLGILANGGWDPHSDGGFLVDRFLWLKTFPAGSGATLTAIFVSDRITQGTGLNTGSGDGWDGGAVAFVFNNPEMGGTNVTLGAYIFPYIHQAQFIGGFGDLDRFTLYSALVDVKTETFKITAEVQGGFGEIKGALGTGPDNILGTADDTRNDSKIKNALIWAVRGEYTAPQTDYLNSIGAEFGWADGDKNDGDSWNNGRDIEGGVIVFNPAYNLDNLLFKHVMPSIYQNAHGSILAKPDASVQNAYYARLYADVPVTDRITFRPQVLVGWNNETEGLIKSATYTGELSGATNVATTDDNTDAAASVVDSDTVKSYLGTEIEGTAIINLYPGIDLNIIGSVIVSGEGLTGLLENQARHLTAGVVESDRADKGFANQAAFEAAVQAEAAKPKANDIIWGVQTKLMIYIDEFFKAGS